MTDLQILKTPPEGLFATPADQLLTKLDGPTLLYLKGRRDPPLFLSVLLHGNETSGWQAICRLLGETEVLERSIILFIGNVRAAAHRVRSLPDQMDFNRIWQGEHKYEPMVSEILDALSAQPLFAALDLHNNTGRNPHYSVVTEITPQTTGLAYLFSDKAVLIEEPDSVLTRAVQHLCPATTVEVGPVNDPQSDERTYELLRRYMTLEQVPEESAEQLLMHRAVARVHVRDEIRFDFADEANASRLLQDDLILTAGMEAVNFHAVPAGTEFGFTRKPLHQTLEILDPQHRDVTDQFLEEREGHVTLRRDVIPAMYTTDHAVVRQDCLCYLMQRI